MATKNAEVIANEKIEDISDLLDKLIFSKSQ